MNRSGYTKNSRTSTRPLSQPVTGSASSRSPRGRSPNRSQSPVSSPPRSPRGRSGSPVRPQISAAKRLERARVRAQSKSPTRPEISPDEKLKRHNEERHRRQQSGLRPHHRSPQRLQREAGQSSLVKGLTDEQLNIVQEYLSHEDERAIRDAAQDAYFRRQVARRSRGVDETRRSRGVEARASRRTPTRSPHKSPHRSPHRSPQREILSANSRRSVHQSNRSRSRSSSRSPSRGRSAVSRELFPRETSPPVDNIRTSVRTPTRRFSSNEVPSSRSLSRSLSRSRSPSRRTPSPSQSNRLPASRSRATSRATSRSPVRNHSRSSRAVSRAASRSPSRRSHGTPVDLDASFEEILEL